jgi:hypothetical protein
MNATAMPQKFDHPALLPPGVHRLDETALFALAVAPFPNDGHRRQLYGQLGNWQNQLRSIGIGGTLWLDGSFLTAKAGPEDIDIVMWNPISKVALDPSAQSVVAALLDKANERAIFGLDLYIESPTPGQQVHREAYWKGFFGFCHDQVTAKGFVEVAL